MTKLSNAHRQAAPPLKLHGLRHTSASLAIANGVDARAVNVPLGHHSPAFTLATFAQAVQEAEEGSAATMACLLTLTADRRVPSG